jgi:glycosyltransferase involved in cell wall biosynthesis
MESVSSPTVGVVIATRDRPVLLRRSVASVVGQEYDGVVETVVVYDQSTPDVAMCSTDPRRPVRVTTNSRTPGLAGARNTGIVSLETDLVAFCDDDDLWLPDKLAAQVERLQADLTAEFCATAIEIEFRDTTSVRVAGTDRVTYDQLLRSRMSMLHSSTFLARRKALLGGIGLVDERTPGSMCEDWDILLRASQRHPVIMVDRPLVRVLWGSTSFFAQHWETKIAAHKWMLQHHPDISTSDVGAARVYGQLAFSYASLHRRRDTWRWAKRALRTNWREPRAYLALAVASRIVSADRVLATLHRRGRGI